MTSMQSETITNETRLTRIQALVVEILNDLLRAPIDEIDDAINRAMARIGVYCKRDRSYVFVRDGEIGHNTHEWCGPNVEPMIEHLQGLPMSLYGSMLDDIFAGRPFQVPDVSVLDPEDPTRQLLEMQGIRSMVLVPMRSGTETYGMMGFDGVEHTHEFLPGELYLLQSVADVICSVLQRRESDRAARAAQSELAGERAFLASILSTSAMGILVLDETGSILFANDAAEGVLGVPVYKMLGAGHLPENWAYAHIDGSELQRGETPFEKVIATGAPVVDQRFALNCPDGVRYCSVHAAPVPSSERQHARVVYAVIDVTEQVRAERAREAALDEARRANIAKSHFLAKMSHEMRTPLNGVLGIAEVLGRLVQDPDQKRMIRLMHDSGSLLLSIINDLLDMSKIEADQLSIEVVPFDILDLAHRLEAVHTLRASEKHLSFGVTVKGMQHVTRLGDPHRLLQILHNVISNAIKFTEEGSVHVEIDCTDAKQVSLRVTDTGIGMTPEEQVHVFEDFGQADTSIARKYGGTGLGMAIVKRLVDMMGGRIEFSSARGEGTRFLISLPLALPDANTTVLPVAKDDGSLPEIDLSGIRVLAADDNRTNRMILSAMMGQLGISPRMVDGGMQALDSFEREEFDAVILDISMPDIDGITVLNEIRAREKDRGGRRVPILAFTANAMAHQVESYMQAGFDECLTKPLQLDRLRGALGALLPATRKVVTGRKIAQAGGSGRSTGQSSIAARASSAVST
ncbi:ATP-binding protein [Pararhodobacter sp. SW119]|uniref:GAF domain-containing hybrid sensor histidine kinase/response regulator n=1 Tax=Pararhodobacter sp. SW119 TaxID=2780075 RepID=UPI001AE0BC2F|nr:ATP-binding protein [Pararhodobacter sp. SW119]